MTYEEILTQLKKYFADLLILQYRNVPKNRAFVALLVDLIFANVIFKQIGDLTVNINNSVGVQLDVVGKWLGLDRYYTTTWVWNKKYFSLPSYSQIKNNNYYDSQGGFSTYSNFTNEGAFLIYSIFQNVRTKVYSMSDEIFRPLCKLKAIKNSINHTMQAIDEAIYNWSEGNVYTTWDTMELTYHYTTDYTNIINLAYNKGILPHPTGVNVIIEEITE